MSHRKMTPMVNGSLWTKIGHIFISWVDSSYVEKRAQIGSVTNVKTDWPRVLPFVGIHVACLLVFWVGISKSAIVVALLTYLIRMFSITAFYHRYFAHKAYKTSRIAQVIFAFIGGASCQRGALWWASQHRRHHRHTDSVDDPHSPRQGFAWSHWGWFLSRKHCQTDLTMVPDLAKYPELKFLNRFDWIPPLTLIVILFIGGEIAQNFGVNTTGAQWLVWGFIVSTVALFHMTFLVNSLCHRQGTRRFDTADDSKNNALVALVTLGEGWHNNHHYFPGSAKQGFSWYEYDPTYWGIFVLNKLKIVHSLKPVPKHVQKAVKLNG